MSASSAFRNFLDRIDTVKFYQMLHKILASLVLLLSVMIAGAQVVKYKLQPTFSVEAVPAKATELGAEVGLEGVRRTFRGGGKHEANHVKAGLHLWYQGTAPTAAAAEAAVAALLADGDAVSTAQVERTPVLYDSQGSL